MRSLLLSFIALLGLFGFVGCASDVVIREPAPEPKVIHGAKVQLKSLWSTRVDADTGIAGGVFRPSIVGQTLYAAGNQGEVVAFELATGKKRWSKALNLPLSAGVAASEKTVIVVGRNGDVISLNDEGQEIWRAPLGKEIIQTPLIHQNMVFVQTTNAHVIALNLDSGLKLWQYRSGALPLTLRGTSQPLVYKNRLLIALDSGTLVALEINSGQLLWERKLQVPKGSNEFDRIVDLDGIMTLQDNVVYVPGYQGYLSAVEAFTGQILWQKQLSSAMQPGFSVGRLYVADADSNLVMLDFRTGEAKWQSEAFKYRALTGPKALGRHLMTSDMSGNVYVLDKSTADVLAKRKLGKAPVALVTVVGPVADATAVAVSQTANGRIRLLELRDLAQE